MRVALLLAVAVLLAGSAPPGRAAARSPIEVGVASSMEKVRPRDELPRARNVELKAARGECEAAQVVLAARGREVEITADAAPLSGPGKLPVALFRVAQLDLALPSGPDGEAGSWPDPLVPARDAFFGEARRAFPVAVPPGRLQAVWVEVCVPGDARPGSYRGSVTLREEGRRLASVPVSLEVWPFALPATGALPVTFGFSTRLATGALGAPEDEAVARAIAAAALRHRITPHGLTFDPPSGRCDEHRCELDWTAYDREMAPVLDGKLVPGVRGAFAEVRIAERVWTGPEPALLATLRAWRRHFEERGWADRLWVYTLDEPKGDKLAELARRARVARQAGIPVFATTVPVPELKGLVRWSPNLLFFDRGGPADELVRAGERPFWYVSCMSHGCGELPERGRERQAMERDLRGWPGYEIDRPGAAARAMGWLAFRHRVAGELYYDMVYAWRGDPWRDVRAFAGNGDGTLLYPGRPAELGGRRPFPVESIRLKLVRDGLEDHELLRLASEGGHRELVERSLARLVPSLRGFERSPRPWLAARREIGDALARSLASR